MKKQGIIIDTKKQNHTAEYISIDHKNIKTSSSVELLGAHIDNKPNFNLHISKVCRFAANQLHNTASDVPKLWRKENVN